MGISNNTATRFSQGIIQLFFEDRTQLQQTGGTLVLLGAAFTGSYLLNLFISELHTEIFLMTLALHVPPVSAVQSLTKTHLCSQSDAL